MTKSDKQRERRIALLERIAAGDARARERFLEDNAPLAMNVAKRYINSGVPIEDLQQSAMMGLTLAVDKFDLSRNTEFSTYATWWIQESVWRAVETQDGAVAKPALWRAMLKRLIGAQTAHDSGAGPAPTDESLGWLPGTLTAVLNLVHPPMSLDAPMNGTEELSLIDTVADPGDFVADVLAGFDEQERRAHVEILMARLTPIQRRVIAAHFGLDGETRRSLRAIGRELELSTERIRQIEEQAIEIMSGRIQPRPEPPDGYITVADAARLAGLSSPHIRNYANSGYVKSVRIGNRRFVSRASVENLKRRKAGRPCKMKNG